MNRFFRFSPSRLALIYIALSALALASFAIPLWYGWQTNIATFREYVHGGDMQRLLDVFASQGATGLAAAIESQVRNLPAGQVIVLADASKLRLAGNLSTWPTEVPETPGVFGLVIDLGGGATMRVVASHMILPGGYHLLMGRESVRFESLVERFWYGIAGAMISVLLLGGVIGWMIRRALLLEVHEISRTASAIVQGDLSHRVALRGGSAELDTLAQTVNGMLEQLARQNLQLEEEIAVRRQAEQALQRAQEDLEGLVAERTSQLARTNESLRQSEAYLAQAQRLSHTGSVFWRPATGEIMWSEETYRIYEYGPEVTPTVQLIRERIHPDDLPLFDETARLAPEKGEDLEFERRLIMPSGAIKHIRFVSRARRNGNGEIEFYGAVMDVTAQRLAERSLQIALQEMQTLKEQFQLAVDTIPGLVWSALPDGYIDFLNQRWLEYTGLTLAEASGWGWQVAIHPEDVFTLVDYWKLVLASGKPAESEARLRRFDGVYRWFSFHAVPLYDGTGKLTKWYGQTIDIDDRKRAGEQLRRSEAYLAEAQRLSLTGSFGWNISSGTIYWSQETFRIFECDPATEPTLELIHQRTHPEDRPLVRQVIDRVLQESKDFDFEHRLLIPDGSVKHIRVVGHPSTQEEVGALEFVGAVTDVSERKRAEEEHRAYLWFLESMDQINRAIQGTNDLEQMMSDVLDAVISIFNCDRAWLVYPCDPQAASWTVPMEHARPEFPGAFALGVALPVTPEMANVFHIVRASSSPVRFGPGSEHPMPAKPAERFSIQSMIAMAIYPKADQPYMLGLHQCSYPRVWTPQEERLFQEIGRRLEDALTSLLIFRNLHESERKLEEAQRLTHVGHWERDPDTDLITWSDETYRIFGLEPQGRSLNLAELPELIHPEDQQIMVQAVADALRGVRRYDVEYRVVRPDGEVRLVHSQGEVTRDESGRPRRMFGSVQDITERKRSEQRLMAQHTVTQILAEAATLEDATPKILETVCEFLKWDFGALWCLDRQAAVLRCVEVWHKPSVEVREFEAISRELTFSRGVGLPGRVWGSREPTYIPDVVHDDKFPRASIAAREGLHAAFGFPILFGSEVLGVMEFFSHQIRQPDEDLLKTMATLGSQIGQFIERNRAEAALHHAQMELAHVARVATLGEMTASIAHEINQPLGAIVNNANACLRWLAAQNFEEARQSAAQVVADGHRAGEIITRIRALANKAPPRKEWLDINETIREVLALARSEVQRSGVALETRLSDDVHYLPLILADRIQLQQVILNLIVNGIEAMSEADNSARELLVSSGTAKARQVVVAVRDSGSGLDPKTLDRIFDPFYTTKTQGMGMGLAISRSIIEAHGGKLWATANQDRGSTFQFTLPTGSENAR